MKNAHKWRVRDGDERDMEKILSLRKIVFKDEEEDKLDPRYWKWEFMEGTEGGALIYIVDYQDRIIGHFADLPRRFSIYGKIVYSTLSVDLMVAPEFRRRGIFEEMGKYAIQRVKEKGGYFMTAYPIRPATIHGFKKIGWLEVLKLPVLVYPIRFQGIVNKYFHFLPISFLIGGIARILYILIYSLSKRSKSRDIGVEEIKEVDDKFEYFLDRTLSLFPIVGVRDKNYMNWRYLHHPTRSYTIYRATEKEEMKGFIILRRLNLLGFNSAVIVDLFALDEESLLALVEEGIAYSKKERVDLLGFMVPKSHLYYHLLKKQGFIRSPKTFLLMIYPHENDNRLLTPDAWYVNWGDTDVI
ncbi:MAG: GNAT family N-acetyltransferase [Thermodesulfobacteriota bacterium]